ncbi:mitochondrial intermediate peptidase, mitochondrial-like isoform X2 [Tripterygium wilfordii]|uniref:mitochondrial intermediate peptidase, mitochondrial-like isoform X2 n=1 Tax=Tripterygium wilfordii TaxID=458696 RepID=UPI0018F83131|nr:mitochondrial intermediate peptidase, mitochondrial-like isoform X2 [Tripterygium wilfordii]
MLFILYSRTDYRHFPGWWVLNGVGIEHLPLIVYILCHLRYCAWDYRVLKRFARHYSTGEIIPEKLVKSMLGARDMFAATELQLQPPSPRDTSSIVAVLNRYA